MAQHQERVPSQQETEEEARSMVAGPGLVATKRQAAGSLIGAIAGLVVGALIGLLIGTIFFDGAGTVISIVCVGVAGLVFGFVSGGIAGPSDRIDARDVDA